MDDLRTLYARDDFKEVWRRVAIDIKIRRFETLDEIPEFSAFPCNIQGQIRYSCANVNSNYEAFRDEGVLYSTAYIVLHDKTKDNWIGWYQYNYATTTGKVLAIGLGAGVLVGGIYYFCGVAQVYMTSVIGYISKNYQTILNAIIQLAGTLLTGAAVTALVRWLQSDHSEWNLLIAACILKKLDGIRNH